MSTEQHHVVVVGGGYAGATAAVRAANRLRGRGRVTLVEPRPALVQRLRLHQVATGQRVQAFNLDRLTGRRVRHLRAAAHRIDADRGVVHVSGPAGREALPFDRLILAAGSRVDDGGVPGVFEHAASLAGPEAAERLADGLGRLREGATVAVCGGGYTSIELAAEIAERRPGLVVRLVSARAVAGPLSERGRHEVLTRLAALGVEVQQDTTVDAVEPGALVLSGGTLVPVDLAVWCGGVAAGPLAWDGALAIDARGRLLVDHELRSVSHPHVLGAGDAAAIPALANGAEVRMTCQTGVPSGAHAADTATRELLGGEPEPFDFGYLAVSLSLGRRDAVVQWVDRADRPKAHVTTGRRAARIKELATRSPVLAIRMERRLPGSLLWLGGGTPQAVLEPAAAA